MRRTKAEAAQTREEIFKAGIKVFAEKGYAAATMADVAREAGCTRGAIYWHFTNKEAFFQETLQRLNTFYDELISSKPSDTASTVDTIGDAVRLVLTRFCRDTEFRKMQELVIRASISSSRGLPGERPVEYVASQDRMIEGFLDEAIFRNEIYTGWTGTIALRAIMSYVAGLLLMIMEHNVDLTDSEIDEYVDFIRRGLAPDRPHRVLPKGASE